MNWLTNFVKPKLIAIKSKLSKKDSLWTKCNSCGHMMFSKELKENLYVCDNCNFHLNMPVEERISNIYDEKKYEELLVDKVIEDPLKFKDKIKYSERLNKVRKNLNLIDAIRVIRGKVNKIAMLSNFWSFIICWRIDDWHLLGMSKERRLR